MRVAMFLFQENSTTTVTLFCSCFSSLSNNLLSQYPAKALSSQNLQKIAVENNNIASIPGGAFETQTSLVEL